MRSSALTFLVPIFLALHRSSNAQSDLSVCLLLAGEGSHDAASTAPQLNCNSVLSAASLASASSLASALGIFQQTAASTTSSLSSQEPVTTLELTLSQSVPSTIQQTAMIPQTTMTQPSTSSQQPTVIPQTTTTELSTSSYQPIVITHTVMNQPSTTSMIQQPMTSQLQSDTSSATLVFSPAPAAACQPYPSALILSLSSSLLSYQQALSNVPMSSATPNLPPRSYTLTSHLAAYLAMPTTVNSAGEFTKNYRTVLGRALTPPASTGEANQTPSAVIIYASLESSSADSALHREPEPMVDLTTSSAPSITSSSIQTTMSSTLPLSPVTSSKISSANMRKTPSMSFLLVCVLWALFFVTPSLANLLELTTQSPPPQEEFCTADPIQGCLNGTPLSQIYSLQSVAKTASAPENEATPTPCLEDHENGCISMTPVSNFWSSTPVASLPSLGFASTWSGSMTTSASWLQTQIPLSTTSEALVSLHLNPTPCSTDIAMLCIGTTVVGPTPCVSVQDKMCVGTVIIGSNPSSHPGSTDSVQQPLSQSTTDTIQMPSSQSTTDSAQLPLSQSTAGSIQQPLSSTITETVQLPLSQSITNMPSITSTGTSRHTASASKTSVNSGGVSIRKPPRIFRALCMLFTLWPDFALGSSPGITQTTTQAGAVATATGAPVNLTECVLNMNGSYCGMLTAQIVVFVPVPTGITTFIQGNTSAATAKSFGVSNKSPPHIFNIICMVFALWPGNTHALSAGDQFTTSGAPLLTNAPTMGAKSTTATPCSSDPIYGCVGKIPVTDIAPPMARPSVCLDQTTASCLGGIVLCGPSSSQLETTALTSKDAGSATMDHYSTSTSTDISTTSVAIRTINASHASTVSVVHTSPGNDVIMPGPWTLFLYAAIWVTTVWIGGLWWSWYCMDLPNWERRTIIVP